MSKYDSRLNYKDEWTECSEEYWRENYNHGEHDAFDFVAETPNNIIIGIRSLGEKNIPHFHFYKGATELWKNWTGGGAIMMIENSYYTHNNHQDTLDKDDFEEVIALLESPHPSFTGSSVWKCILNSWNSDYPEYEIPNNLPIPEYNFTTIKN